MTKDERRAKFFGDFSNLNTKSKRAKAITRANKIRASQSKDVDITLLRNTIFGLETLGRANSYETIK